MAMEKTEGCMHEKGDWTRVSEHLSYQCHWCGSTLIFEADSGDLIQVEPPLIVVIESQTHGS